MSETRCSCGHAERAHVMSNPRTRQLCRECRCNQFDAERSEPAAASVPLSADTEGLRDELFVKSRLRTLAVQIEGTDVCGGALDAQDEAMLLRDTLAYIERIERLAAQTVAQAPQDCACGHSLDLHNKSGQCMVVLCDCVREAPEGAAPAGATTRVHPPDCPCCAYLQPDAPAVSREASVPQGGEFTAAEVEAQAAAEHYYRWATTGNTHGVQRTIDMLRAYARALSSAPGEREGR
jgi:hypothetical protein